MKLAILTSPDQWFEPFAEQLAKELDADLFHVHEEIEQEYDIFFILSYHRVVDDRALKKNRHNIVIHESDLPKGKGWAPLFWQVIEGKDEIVFSLFEASEQLDSGEIYLQKTLKLTGYELNPELRNKQAELTLDMCKDFVADYENYISNPKKQIGEETFYSKRSSKDSQLDVDKTIREQFNLLRTVDNDNYPAFFEIDGNRYILRIERG